MEKWKERQLSLVGNKVRDSLQEAEGQDSLRLELFDYVFAQTIEREKSNSPFSLIKEERLDDICLSVLCDKQKYKDASVEGKKEILGVKRRSERAALKRYLEGFFATQDSKKLPMSLRVIEGPRYLEYNPQDCAMKLFWEPYFHQDCTLVHIVYGENVFFRTGHDKRIFIRHLDCNDQGKIGEKDIQEKSGLPAEWWWQGGTQFTSSGDCAAVVRLVQQFERNGLPTHVIRAAELPKGWEPSDNEGLIVLGNGRVIPSIAKLLKAGEFDWQIEAKGIKNRQHRENPEDDFSKPFINGIVARTRRDGGWLTIIAANHGRFCEASVKCFSSERDLVRVFEANGWQLLPERFEFKARVDLTELEDVSRESMSPIPYVVVTD